MTPRSPIENSFAVPACGYNPDALMSITTSQLLTAEDLWRLPNNQRRELVKGELRTMAPAGFDHGAVIMNLSIRLAQHVKAKRLGIVVGAETGFLLARNPDTVRGADIAFVSTARLPQGERPQGYFPGPPDLAVEVISPGDTNAQVEDKVDDYLKAGARLVWVVNPRRRTVTIHRPQTPPAMLGETETLADDDVVPQFRCSVAEIFA
jgi:Uma2 family endonuclease